MNCLSCGEEYPNTQSKCPRCGFQAIGNNPPDITETSKSALKLPDFFWNFIFLILFLIVLLAVIFFRFDSIL